MDNQIILSNPLTTPPLAPHYFSFSNRSAKNDQDLDKLLQDKVLDQEHDLAVSATSSKVLDNKLSAVCEIITGLSLDG